MDIGTGPCAHHDKIDLMWTRADFWMCKGVCMSFLMKGPGTQQASHFHLLSKLQLGTTSICQVACVAYVTSVTLLVLCLDLCTCNVKDTRLFYTISCGHLKFTGHRFMSALFSRLNRTLVCFPAWCASFLKM